MTHTAAQPGQVAFYSLGSYRDVKEAIDNGGLGMSSALQAAINKPLSSALLNVINTCSLSITITSQLVYVLQVMRRLSP